MAISRDLRERIIGDEEGSSTQVGRRFGVSASFVRKLRGQYRRLGHFDRLLAPGRERLIQGEEEAVVRQCLEETPDATLSELRARVGSLTGVQVSETTMWRTLQRMGYTLKKNRSGQLSRTVPR